MHAQAVRVRVQMYSVNTEENSVGFCKFSCDVNLAQSISQLLFVHHNGQTTLFMWAGDTSFIRNTSANVANLNSHVSVNRPHCDTRNADLNI